MIFDQFDIIRIINLPHRTDRREEMEGELKKVGLLGDPRVAFFEASRFDDPGPFDSIGARGCFHSHLSILEEAIAEKKTVLILEDDVDFTRAAHEFELPKHWSVFYGGYHAADPDDLQNCNIVGSHMMGFRSEVLEKVIHYLRTAKTPGFHAPIDGAYVNFRRANPDVETVFAEPVLAVQRPSRTDIADPRFFDRLPVIREAVTLARKIKRRLSRQ